VNDKTVRSELLVYWFIKAFIRLTKGWALLIILAEATDESTKLMQYKLVVNISKKELKVIRKCLLVYIRDQFNILLQSKELIFTLACKN